MLKNRGFTIILKTSDKDLNTDLTAKFSQIEQLLFGYQSTNENALTEIITKLDDYQNNINTQDTVPVQEIQTSFAEISDIKNRITELSESFKALNYEKGSTEDNISYFVSEKLQELSLNLEQLTEDFDTKLQHGFAYNAELIEEKKLNKDEVVTSKLIGIGAETEIKHGFMNALDYAYKKFGSLVSTLFLILGSLFTGKLGLDALSGPVGMYTVVNTVAAYGLSNILYLAAYLSINLGIINILPFPAFDGGRVLFIGIEAITGKKVDSKIEGYFHTIGFMLIMLLMLYITWHDIVTLFF